MASRTIDDSGTQRANRHGGKIDEDDTLRLVGEDLSEEDLNLDGDETDPGDRRRDPLRQPR